ncbi:MAG: acyl carrier protein [Psychroserpens sp.]|jgi:acyl carrier protein
MHVLFLGPIKTIKNYRSKNTMEERYEQLKGIIKIYLPEDVTVEDITPESHFINELNINSANLVDIVLDVEDAFNIVLENEDMDQMKTVKDALAIIDNKLKAS